MCEDNCMKCGTKYRHGSSKYRIDVSYGSYKESLGYMCKRCYADFLLGLNKVVKQKEECPLEPRVCNIDSRGWVKFTPEQREDICELYKQGYTIADISHAYGLTDLEKVKGVLRRAGFRWKGTDIASAASIEEKKDEPEPDIKDLGRVGAYMDAGWPPQKIANEFGVELITAKRAINTVIRYRKMKKEEIENGNKKVNK